MIKSHKAKRFSKRLKSNYKWLHIIVCVLCQVQQQMHHNSLHFFFSFSFLGRKGDFDVYTKNKFI